MTFDLCWLSPKGVDAPLITMQWKHVTISYCVENVAALFILYAKNAKHE